MLLTFWIMLLMATLLQSNYDSCNITSEMYHFYVLEVTVCTDKSVPSFACFDIKIFYLFNSE